MLFGAPTRQVPSLAPRTFVRAEREGWLEELFALYFPFGDVFSGKTAFFTARYIWCGRYMQRSGR